MRPTKSILAYRLIPGLLALFLFLALSAIYLSGNRLVYIDLIRLFGVDPHTPPFLDIGAILAAWDCTREGAVVIGYDSCDVLGRGFDYSPFLLLGAIMPVGMDSAGKVGYAVDLIFIFCLFFLPPARGWPHLILVIFATLSPTVVFALERANIDVVLFVLALASAFLATACGKARLLAYGLIVLGALVKYYPITLLLISVRERFRVFIGIGIFALATISFFILHYLPIIQVSIPKIPSGQYFSDMFGAENLPKGIANLAFASGLIGSPSSLSQRLFLGILYAALLVFAACGCNRLLMNAQVRVALSSLSKSEQLVVLTGSILVIGCFFAGQSIAYRGIFLLMVLPGFMGLAHPRVDMPLRRIATCGALALIFVMWSKPYLLGWSHLFQPDTAPLVAILFLCIWLLQELAWWWIVGFMLAFCWVCLRDVKPSSIAGSSN